MAVFGMIEGSIKVSLASGGSLTVGISRSAGNAETFEEVGKALGVAFSEATAKLHEGPCRDKIAALEKKVATMTAMASPQVGATNFVGVAIQPQTEPVSRSSYRRAKDK